MVVQNRHTIDDAIERNNLGIQGLSHFAGNIRTRVDHKLNAIHNSILT